jgi:glutamate/tyrosine decarboxylase-like PLP-dependent enzyme
MFDDWLGGFYGSPNMQGSRPALPMACAWAVMMHLGLEGYVRLTKSTIDATRRMIAGARELGLTVLGEPDAHILSMASDDVDVFALGDALLERGGWFHDRQSPPDSLHATVSAGNAPMIDEYLADLAQCIDQVRGKRTDDRSTNYAATE